MVIIFDLARIFHEEAVLVSFCSSLEFVEA